MSINELFSEWTEGRWIDISVRLHDGMLHWPGDPEVSINKVADVEKGDRHTISEICMGSHSGTHVDAPRHFIKGGTSIDEMPLDVMMGEARVIEIKDEEAINRAELEKNDIQPGERILFKTKNSQRVWKTGSFVSDYVALSLDAATFLAERQVKMVGMDYLSVGPYKKDGKIVHETLLKNGVWIMEALDLSGVSAGRYYLACLPLRIAGGDAAPARAVVRPIGPS
jgi:arylformamidase